MCISVPAACVLRACMSVVPGAAGKSFRGDRTQSSVLSILSGWEIVGSEMTAVVLNLLCIQAPQAYCWEQGSLVCAFLPVILVPGRKGKSGPWMGAEPSLVLSERRGYRGLREKSLSGRCRVSSLPQRPPPSLYEEMAIACPKCFI